jgi:hypothetical protein
VGRLSGVFLAAGGLMVDRFFGRLAVHRNYGATVVGSGRLGLVAEVGGKSCLYEVVLGLVDVFVVFGSLLGLFRGLEVLKVGSVFVGVGHGFGKRLAGLFSGSLFQLLALAAEAHGSRLQGRIQQLFFLLLVFFGLVIHKLEPFWLIPKVEQYFFGHFPLTFTLLG